MAYCETNKMIPDERSYLRDSKHARELRYHGRQVFILQYSGGGLCGCVSPPPWATWGKRPSYAVPRMRRCQHDQCQVCASFNFDDDKTGKYCKRHAEDGMVNVINKRCLHDTCSQRPCFNLEGSKTGKYCKRHAEDGMSNVLAQRCFYNACSKIPSFYAESNKTAKYCKEHADGGMVRLRGKSCLHNTCVVFPRHNVKGSKTGKYCKQHAKDGMVNVFGKRCSHDSCTVFAKFGFKRSKTADYCNTHAKDGMINVVTRRCSHDSCMEFGYYRVKGSRIPVYCKEHTEEGMVHVRPKRSGSRRRTEGSAQGVHADVAAIVNTTNKNDRSGGSLITPDLPNDAVACQKRSSLEVDGIQRPNCMKHGLFEKRGNLESEGIASIKNSLRSSSSRALPRHPNDSIIKGTVANQTRKPSLRSVAPLFDEHQSEQRIKTETGIDVFF